MTQHIHTLRWPLALAGLAFLAGCGRVGAAEPAAAAATTDAPTTAPTEEPADEAGDAVAFEIAFVTHLDMNLPEQDVYIEREPGSGEVFRVTKGDHDMRAPLFKTAVEVEHNPFDDAAIGPHPKGEPLGMTLGQWLHHQGTGKYTFEDGVGHLELSFSGLVPNGVYTMWHAFAAIPPTEPFSGVLDMPLGARDGSESVFVADENGKAAFDHSFSPGLQMSDTWTTSMLAIAYHSDDRTHGGVAGDFGLNAHVPLFVMLPKRKGLE